MSEEKTRWFGIPEPVLVQVIHLLTRPPFDVLETVTVLQHLPEVEVSEEEHDPIGFAPPDDSA